MDYSDPLERATKPRDRGETWTDEQFRAARDSDLTERTVDIGKSVIAALSCLVLAALLTSGKIVEIAERRELGDARDRQLAMAERLDDVANFLSLNRPYDLILDIRGAGKDVGERVDDLSALVASTTTMPTTAPATGTQGNSPPPTQHPALEPCLQMPLLSEQRNPTSSSPSSVSSSAASRPASAPPAPSDLVLPTITVCP